MPGSTARSPPGRSGGDRGLRVIVGRIREARDETIDLLFALTSFQTVDVLAGPTRTSRRSCSVPPGRSWTFRFDFARPDR